MNQLFRVIMSFAIVMVAYWAYALVVVPAISPSVDPENRDTVSSDMIEGAKGRAERQAQELSALFPPNSWEIVSKPKVLESDQAKLLVGDYTTQPDGHVLLKPCTIIFFPKEELHDAPLIERQAIILETPEGALLKFDRSFDLSRGQFGNLIGGSVKGPVTIRSEGKPNDPDDDLRIMTRDVQLSEQWITTNEAVRFQYGKHSGSGRRMRIELEQEDKDARTKKKSTGPQVKGMRSFQLRKVDYLRMLVPEEGTGQPKNETQNVAQASQENAEPKLVPVEVGCSGEFRFDVTEHRAAFKEDVVVSRFRTDGPADQLLCDELVIHFAQGKVKPSDAKTKASVKKGKAGEGLGGLTPSWLEARGIKRPATIRSTVEKVEAFARELQYHLTDRRIVLQDESGKEPVRLNQAENIFIAKYLEYCPSQETLGGLGEKSPKGDTKQSSLGQLVADGPGVITARPNEESDQLFTATWQKELRLQPHEKNQVISLTGGATLDYGPVGRLTADSIHFFLLEKPTKKNDGASGEKPGEKIATNLQPDRMRADGDVKIESQELSGEVEQFQVWFETDESSPSGYTATPIQPDGRSNASPPVSTPFPRTGSYPGMPISSATMTPLGVMAPTAPGVAFQGAGPPGMIPQGMSPGIPPGMPDPTNVTQQPVEPKQHFHIKGRLLQAHILLREAIKPDGTKKRVTEVTELTILDNVELIETQTDRPDVEPIIAKGDRVHVQDATLPSTSLSMFGRPAEFVGRGLGLTGANINLNRGTNRLWVNGPGRMRLPPMDKDLRGRPVAVPEAAIIDWQQEMDFDGRTITFLDQVIAETKNQKLYTEQLSVTLTKKIDFAKADKAMQDGPDRPDLLLLTCHGGVKINSNMYDELGRLESIETGEMSNMKIDRATGKVYAEGPGLVHSVRRGGEKMMQEFGPPGMSSARTRPPYGSNQVSQVSSVSTNPVDTKDKLTYIKIRFQGYIDGDINGRLMAFNKQVHGTFGYVADWNQKLPEDDADALGDEGAMLRCQRLQLLQMPSPTGGDPNTEMEATGNVSIEGRQFTAQGYRASYSREKELIILEGDGRTDAKLYRQEKIGAAPDEISAKKIMYWPERDQYMIGGSQSLQFQLNPTR